MNLVAKENYVNLSGISLITTWDSN